MSEIWAQLIYIKLTIFIQLDFYHTLFHCFSIHVGVVVPQLSLAVSSRFCFLSFFLSFSILVSLYSFVCVCVWGRDSSPNPASGRTHLCFLMTLPRSHYLRYWLRISLRWATQLVKTPAPASLCFFSASASIDFYHLFPEERILDSMDRMCRFPSSLEHNFPCYLVIVVYMYYFTV